MALGPGVGSLRWACTFHIFCFDFVSNANPFFSGIWVNSCFNKSMHTYIVTKEENFQWNMGLTVVSINLCIHILLLSKEIIQLTLYNNDNQ